MVCNSELYYYYLRSYGSTSLYENWTLSLLNA